MLNYNIQRIANAIDLPHQWDELAQIFFQQKEFLTHTEKYNPCNQRYYLMWHGSDLIAGACVYTLPIHLFTFSHIPSKIHMQVIGLAASVSSPGIIGKTKADTEKLIQYILKNEKGLILGLNLPAHINVLPAVEMTMMPTVVMKQNADSWDAYLSQLRSPYRRRAHQIIKSFNQVGEFRTLCNAFTEKHYNLYLQIMKKTKNKLETLSFDFFKHLPHNFYLSSYYHDKQLLCWHINCRDKNQLFFFFGGHDYTLLNKYHSYFNNLFGILREAIEDGYKLIDFGQTAETAKMKIGGQMEERQLFLYHRYAFVRTILKLFKPLITYKPPEKIVHPMKPTTVFIHPSNIKNENIIREASTFS